MLGLQILARAMSTPTKGSPGGKPFLHHRAWQYHPRSDRHSKVACWGVLFDLLQECKLLRVHAEQGVVGFGINHPMRDFARNRKKNLDLVLCAVQAGLASGGERSFASLADDYDIVLSQLERRALDDLPPLRMAQPASVLLALEAKACMTEFGKARPRLYDELNSSQLSIHGDTDSAIAAGFALVNAAETFVSPLRNQWPDGALATAVSKHNQPRDAASVVEKLMELPRRAKQGDEGFDALGIVLVHCANDGTPVTIVDEPPAPGPSDIYRYEQFIRRTAKLYATRFAEI